MQGTPQVTTTTQVHDQHAQNVAQSLTAAGLPTSPAQVKPVTNETPLITQDLKSLGGIVPGEEDLEYGLKDLQYMAEADLKHGDKIRTTESKNPLKMLMGRFLRKKKENEEIVERK